MDLKPSPEVISSLQQAKAAEKAARKERKKTEAIQQERQNEVDRTKDFQQKLRQVKLDKKPGYGEGSKASEWVTIREDADTKTTLQAQVEYNYTKGEHVRDYGYVDQLTIYSLNARFIDAKGTAVNAGLVAELRTGEKQNALRVGSALGLTEGWQQLKPTSDVDASVIDQILEIEQEVLDPILAAQQTS